MEHFVLISGEGLVLCRWLRSGMPKEMLSLAAEERDAYPADDCKQVYVA